MGGKSAGSAATSVGSVRHTEKDVAVREICPSGNGGQRHSEGRGLDGGKAATITLSPATMRDIARDPLTHGAVEGIDPAKARELAEANAKSQGRF